MAMTESISTGAVVTWGGQSLGKLTDFGISGSCDAKEVTGQDSGGNREYLPGLREISYTLSLVWDDQDTGHALLQTDFDAGNKKTLAITPLVGQTPHSIEAAVESIGRPMALGERLQADVAFMLTDSSTVGSTGD